MPVIVLAVGGRRLDADDVGAPVGEMPHAGRPGAGERQVEHREPVQRHAGLAPELLLGALRVRRAVRHPDPSQCAPILRLSRRALKGCDCATMRGMDPVDLALVLALDCSASVTFDEFNLMAGAMGAALRDAEVIAGLTGGPARASLGALLLWSGAGAQEVLVEWTRIESRDDGEGVRRRGGERGARCRAGETAIGEALLAA